MKTSFLAFVLSAIALGAQAATNDPEAIWKTVSDHVRGHDADPDRISDPAQQELVMGPVLHLGL
jgi:hypothetical protein